MKSIVINTCYGGFQLSAEAMDIYNSKREAKGLTKIAYDYDISRDDEDLVSVVSLINQSAETWCSDLKIVEIPDDVEWEILEFDGLEMVIDINRFWQ